MVIQSSSMRMGSVYHWKQTYKQSYSETFSRAGSDKMSSKNSQEYVSESEYTSQSTLLDTGETAVYGNFSRYDRNTLLSASNVDNTTASSLTNSGSISDSILLRLLEIFLGNRRDVLSKIKEELGLSTDSGTSTFTRQTSYSASITTSESVSFASTGTAITADGRALSFNVEVEMSEEFRQQTNYETTEEGITLTDPLVVWLDSNPETISDQKFTFDLNCDGVKEELSALNKSKGFLSYDANGNGKIDNGSELFGAKTGDGFHELAKYDLDNNGFIDEADAIFQKLSVWRRDENGNDVTVDLKIAGIGAISLGNMATKLTYIDHNTGSTTGRVKSSGFYFKENGTAGIIQQLDFATRAIS